MCDYEATNFFPVEEAEEIFEQGWDGDPDLAPACPVFDDEGEIVGYTSLL